MTLLIGVEQSGEEFDWESPLVGNFRGHLEVQMPNELDAVCYDVALKFFQTSPVFFIEVMI